MMEGIYNEFELELVQAARLVLRDGVRRLKDRQALFHTTKMLSRQEKEACKKARETVVDMLVADYGSLRHEMACAVLIDAQGRLISIETFPEGKATHVEISARILARMIIEGGAAAVLLAHNHPSGDNTPSGQDVKVTQVYKEWLRLMDCELIDHLVLSSEGASSILGEWV